MCWNPRANRLPTSSGWVGLNFFYKFQYELIFDSTHLEPDWSGLNLWWAGLVSQPADKRVTQVFLLGWTLHLGHLRLFFLVNT